MTINIDILLEELKSGKTVRSQKNIEKLNHILISYVESGQKDFSITTIGRISAIEGGPGYEAIRATRNNHYRRLIEAWAYNCNTTLKKPLSAGSKSTFIPTDNKLLELIQDPALRALFGQIIAERNKYRKEINLLKQHTNIIIDKRADTHTENNISSFSNILNEFECSALKYALSDECMQNNDWQTTQAGQVKHLEYNKEIFPRGFITGLRKLLEKYSLI